jgi:hypothetical protein
MGGTFGGCEIEEGRGESRGLFRGHLLRAISFAVRRANAAIVSDGLAAPKLGNRLDPAMNRLG